MKNLLLFLSLNLFFVASLQAQFFSKPQERESDVGAITKNGSRYNREMVLGNILKGALENMHLSNKSIDDKLSKGAFDLYLERVDYGKQFLIESDVQALKKFTNTFDDELVSGQLSVIDTTTKMLSTRIKEVQGYVDEILKTPFDYNKKEILETDPEKRKFVKSSKELKDLWSKLLKYETLTRIADLEEEKKNPPVVEEKSKSKNKKKKASVADGEDLSKMSSSDIEAKARKKVAETYKKILSRLLEEKQSDKLDKFYNAITRVFDPHTNYLAPEEKEDFDIDMSGKLEGIGAILREEGSYIKVERIVPGSASWKTKQLEAEDTILKVAQGTDEPVDVVDMSLREAVKLIRGKKGTEVRLTVKKPNGLLKVVPIIRDVVEIEDSYVKGSILELEKSKLKIGYINVPKFYRDFNDRSGRNCTDDTKVELQKLKKAGIDGLILDLRNNGGGALEDARLISGLFIDKGPIVQVKASTGSVEILADQDPSIDFDKPMIVLINRFSASASEIVAAALQDYKRAVIVGGEFSHGKGTVQLVVDLDNYVSSMGKAYSPLGSLKITIQKFYRINGGSTQYKGVTPDVILPDPYAHLESGEKFLKNSIPWGEVKAVPYRLWNKPLEYKKLQVNSLDRVKKNPRFQKLNQSIKWYLDRKEKTSRSLALNDFMKEKKEIQDKAESLKMEDELLSLKVVDIGAVKSELDKAHQEKFDEFSKGLKQDPTIEESFYILSDMIKK